MKGLQCIETVEAHNPSVMTKQAYSNWLKILKRSWMEATQSDSHEEKKKEISKEERVFIHVEVE